MSVLFAYAKDIGEQHTLFEVLHVTRGQSDTDLVDLDFHLLFVAGLHVGLWCLVRHGVDGVVGL